MAFTPAMGPMSQHAAAFFGKWRELGTGWGERRYEVPTQGVWFTSAGQRLRACARVGGGVSRVLSLACLVFAQRGARRRHPGERRFDLGSAGDADYREPRQATSR